MDARGEWRAGAGFYMFPNFSSRLLSAGFSELFVYVVFGLFVCFERKSYKSFRFTSNPPFSCLAFQVLGLQVSRHAWSVYFYTSFSLRVDCLQSSGSTLRIAFASLTLYPTASGFSMPSSFFQVSFPPNYRPRTLLPLFIWTQLPHDNWVLPHY